MIFYPFFKLKIKIYWFRVLLESLRRLEFCCLTSPFYLDQDSLLDLSPMVPHAQRFPLCAVKEKSHELISNLTYISELTYLWFQWEHFKILLAETQCLASTKANQFPDQFCPQTSLIRWSSSYSPPQSRCVSALFNWTLVILVPQTYNRVAVSASVKSDSFLHELFPRVTVTWFWSHPSSTATGHVLLIHTGGIRVMYSTGCDFKGWSGWRFFKRME